MKNYLNQLRGLSYDWTLIFPLWLYTSQYMRIGFNTNVVGHYFLWRRIVVFNDGGWRMIFRPYL